MSGTITPIANYVSITESTTGLNSSFYNTGFFEDNGIYYSIFINRTVHNTPKSYAELEIYRLNSMTNVWDLYRTSTLEIPDDIDTLIQNRAPGLHYDFNGTDLSVVIFFSYDAGTGNANTLNLVKFQNLSSFPTIITNSITFTDSSNLNRNVIPIIFDEVNNNIFAYARNQFTNNGSDKNINLDRYEFEYNTLNEKIGSPFDRVLTIVGGSSISSSTSSLSFKQMSNNNIGLEFLVSARSYLLIFEPNSTNTLPDTLISPSNFSNYSKDFSTFEVDEIYDFQSTPFPDKYLVSGFTLGQNNTRNVTFEYDINNIVSTPVSMLSDVSNGDVLNRALPYRISVEPVQNGIIVSLPNLTAGDERMDLYSLTQPASNLVLTSEANYSMDLFSELTNLPLRGTEIISTSNRTGADEILILNYIGATNASNLSRGFALVSYQGTLACLLEGTKILTPNGYKLIEQLKKNDQVITGDNRITTIDKIYSSSIKGENVDAYTIPKGTYGAINDTTMTKYHAIINNNRLEFSMNLKKAKKFIPCKTKIYKFFHVVLSDKNLDTIIANGIITEGYGERIKKFAPKYRNKNMEFMKQFN